MSERSFVEKPFLDQLAAVGRADDHYFVAASLKGFGETEDVAVGLSFVFDRVGGYLGDSELWLGFRHWGDGTGVRRADYWLAVNRQFPIRS